jgi:hypothetical protein
MTDKEKYDFLKKAYPTKSDAEIKAAVKEFQVLEGGLAGGQIAKKLLEFGQSIFAKKTAAKVAEEAAKVGKKKLITKKRVYTTIGAAGAVGTYNAIASGSKAPIVDTGSAEAAAEAELVNAVATADAQGLPIASLLSGDRAKQIGITANNIGDVMAKYGLSSTLSGIGNVGVFTGKEVITSIPRKKFGGTISGTKKELVSLSDWNKSFPVDAAGIAAAKQKFVSAGVLSPTADLTQVKSAWTTYGKLSEDYSRAGNVVSPWQLLDIQKGLTGSGSQTTTTIDDSPMAKADITTLLKRQLGASLGLTNIDDAVINKFIADVRKKEAKNPTKSVRTTTGNTTRVKTTPGYGQSDVLADAEAFAKQDPRYAEFQTADVFGNALVKALGLKS